MLVSIEIYGQSKEEIQGLLREVGEQTLNSKEIKHNKAAIRVMDYGVEIIPKLIGSFSNSSNTKTYSECQERNLTVGEIAIILVDKIEPMPYFQITGVQNCLLTFCDKNDNLIEYYLQWDDKRNQKQFADKYSNWFSSKDRKGWTNSFKERTDKNKD